MTIPDQLKPVLLEYENLLWVHRDVPATGPQLMDYVGYLGLSVERLGRITAPTVWEAMVHTETGALATRMATHVPGSYDPAAPGITEDETMLLRRWICALTRSEGDHVGAGQISDPAALEVIRAAGIDDGPRICPDWTITTWPGLREACIWHRRARNAARTTPTTTATSTSQAPAPGRTADPPTSGPS